MDIKEKIKNLPSSPGVYLMKDSQGRIIYVGKSKNLKQRVQTYFYHNKTHSRKIKQLVKTLVDFEYIQTDTEFEAFLLECRLIQEIKPYFNRLLKNPLAYTYIKIHWEGEIRRITITNTKEEEKDEIYFGPFTSKSTTVKAIDGLMSFYKIDCQHLNNKKSPCLNHTLGLCIGVCLGGPALEEYNSIVEEITQLFSGTNTSVLDRMNEKMVHAAEQFDFKTAGKYRDYIHAIQSIVKKEQVIEFTVENKNIVIQEYINDHTSKIFFVKGKDVLYDEKINHLEYDNESLAKIMEEHIFHYFEGSLQVPTRVVDREEIDEAQITYSYIQSSNCRHFIIPEKWILQKQTDNIYREIVKLLTYLRIPIRNL